MLESFHLVSLQGIAFHSKWEIAEHSKPFKHTPRRQAVDNGERPTLAYPRNTPKRDQDAPPNKQNQALLGTDYLRAKT